MKRQFSILVERGTKFLQYPPQSGAMAIYIMESMKRRGFRCCAMTEANGITEYLSIEEMREAVIV